MVPLIRSNPLDGCKGEQLDTGIGSQVFARLRTMGASYFFVVDDMVALRGIPVGNVGQKQK